MAGSQARSAGKIPKRGVTSHPSYYMYVTPAFVYPWA